jgi:8-oxo-dGTP pyrophosphatase MutT (NUDIX family)
MPQQEVQHIPQAAAIPLRVNPRTDRVEVLLIRRRGRADWGIPKGHVDPGLTGAEAAAMEAREEAGVEGSTGDAPVGSYVYDKNGGSYAVQVFVLHVTETLSSWEEQAQRERRWFDAAEAADAVGRAEVARMIARASSAAARAR